MGSRYRRHDVVRPNAVKRALLLVAALAVMASCSEKQATPTSSAAATRVVSLAPNLTELVFTVGAGDKLVGVSAWSDYPREVLKLPVVGDAFTIDQEQLALANPDLLLVWEDGTPSHVIDKLRSIGYNVVAVKTKSLDDVAEALLTIGKLTGHSREAAVAASQYRAELQSLRDTYEGLPAIRVFYQVAARPLYTINNEHYISELISTCGGDNIFEDLTELAPTIDVEAVVDRNPEVMLASTDAGGDAFLEWERWPDIAAIRLGNQFLLPADEIGRATTRIIVAGNAMCLALLQARHNRDAAVQE
jgi:iron complex transport system substrate-binding protein